ncbi:MAG TPA: ABC transporter substrate-binding protein [Stellaceae bacterium]|nr:ABC transporter substrate-binding protein [Stellaceae bacterium]
MTIARTATVAVIALVVGVASDRVRAAEPIKIGVEYSAEDGPVFIAKEKGYFAAEGLDADLVRYESADPVAVAAVSSAVDVGAAGITGALYTLATQDAVRLVAGLAYDGPGHRGFAIIVSSKAEAQGLRSFDDLPGHSVAVAGTGSPFQYALAIACEKHGIDLRTMHFLPRSSAADVASAVAGGQADVGVLPAPLVGAGAGKILAWVGDETPWQMAAVWVSRRTAEDRADMITRFLRALRKGSSDYAAAFIPTDGPGAAQDYPILQKYLGQPVLADVDPDARLDVDDIEHQIEWFREEGVVRGDIDTDRLIDKRFVVPLPSR